MPKVRPARFKFRRSKMFDKLYTIYDRIALEGSPPFIAKNDGVATRHYNQVLDSSPNVCLQDYRLYCVGEWDTEKLRIEPVSPPREVFATQVQYDQENGSEDVLEPIKAGIYETP